MDAWISDRNEDVRRMVRAYVEKHPPSREHGRIHPVDPAAVTHFKRYLALEQKEASDEKETQMESNSLRDMHQRYMDGESMKKLAKEAGIPWQRLSADFKNAGLPSRTRKKKEPTPPQLQRKSRRKRHPQYQKMGAARRRWKTARPSSFIWCDWWKRCRPPARMLR